MSLTREQLKQRRRKRRLIGAGICICWFAVIIIGFARIYQQAMALELPHYEDGQVPNAYTEGYEVVLY